MEEPKGVEEAEDPLQTKLDDFLPVAKHSRLRKVSNVNGKGGDGVVSSPAAETPLKEKKEKSKAMAGSGAKASTGRRSNSKLSELHELQ